MFALVRVSRGVAWMLAVLGVFGFGVPAFATDYTSLGGPWDTITNWSPNGRPMGGDNVTIPNGVTCTITNASNQDEACNILTVASTGRLAIEGERALTLNADAVLDGTVSLQGALNLGASLTISGDGKLYMQVDSGVYSAAIGGTGTLTLSDDAGGNVLTVSGTGDVNRPLVNDAIVQAGEDGTNGSFDGVLNLNGAVSGSGTYQAAFGETLEVEAEASGLATWKTQTDSDNNRIIMKVESCVSGHVQIPRGTFRVEADFCTTGNLILGDDTDLQDADVEVTKDITATFGLGTSANCSCS